jgi:putative ABC transport system permease protein
VINLAARDIGHHLGRFVFTGVGLGLLIGVTLTMAGVFRGMVADGRALLAASGADLWVVQKDTLGPWAEPSSASATISIAAWPACPAWPRPPMSPT